ncbi:MAG: mandelate racemase/muconate lactonizing enzyme family protein [Acidobacteria bacterium]|nr:mandelate racemase/muconate lactonizing enzyme family protein [Acidobacteriota bacterium]
MTTILTRRELLGGTGLAALASGAPGASARAAQSARGQVSDLRPLIIERVEPIVIRTPPDRIGFDEPLMQPRVGAVTGGPGMWNRLDHATPTRFKGYEQATLVKITTTEGLVGWGECHSPSAPRMHQRILSDLFAPLLRGQDARWINPLWERMFSTERVRGYSTGAHFEALAGVDLALWDLLGRAMGVPVYQLLGGKYRDGIPLYTGIGGATAEALVQSAERAVASGLKVVKMGFRKGENTSDVERVEAVAAAMRPHGQVCLDSLGAFKLYEAIQVGRIFDRIGNIGWFEDALLPDDWPAYTELAAALDTPVCVGEMLSNRFQFRDLLTARGADIINPDVCRAGGISECQRIAALAHAYGALWTPHVSTGTVLYFAASLHLAVATANCVIMEGGGKLSGPLGNALVRTPFRVDQGTAYVPEAPGFGVEWNEEALARVTAREA